MRTSDFWRNVLFYLSAPRCVCCKVRLISPYFPLCSSCLKTYQESKDRECGVCKKLISRCDCPNHYLNTHYVHQLYKVTRYLKRKNPNPANALIYSLKQDHRKDTVDFMAKELSLSLAKFRFDKDLVMTNVARRRKAGKIYGYDHAALLARKTSKLLGVKYVPTLVSHAKTAQKNLKGNERKINATFSVKRNVSLDKMKVIIIDDVVTTGSSMAAAASALKKAGAKKIIGAAFAIAYTDPFVSYHN